jgi:hypothetical protein
MNSKIIVQWTQIYSSYKQIIQYAAMEGQKNKLGSAAKYLEFTLHHLCELHDVSATQWGRAVAGCLTRLENR